MIGQSIAHYRVTEKIGAGGMGEVYRATDTKLNREVALKVLPEQFAKDPDRMARFKREAQVLASLNHPNIAAIYGLEEDNGTHALVLELVEGPTLADRIQQGALPLDEALGIARQMADALEAAHEQGIIHRDLKPANVKVREDATVKVLDFGLAKALEDPGSEEDIANSPTLSVAATRAGVILGTAAYMSPEQAHGRKVDRRCDIWSFGVVLYEMLAGRRLFVGESISDTMAAVLRAEVDWDALPSDLPASIRRLLRRCLTRDRKQRLQAVGDARLEIEEALAGAAEETPVAATETTEPWKRALPWGVTAVLGLVALISLVAAWRAGQRAPRSLARYEVTLPADQTLFLLDEPTLALSAEGQQMVYAALKEDGETQLFLRVRDQLNPRPIAGTEGGTSPFFSPDGEWLGFFADSHVKKVHLASGMVTTLAPTPQPRGGVWLPDDTIVYSPAYVSGLLQISANGGTPEELTVADPEKGERSHRWPTALPGGRVVLFTVGTVDSPNNYDRSPIAALDLVTGERKTVIEGGNMARYAASGHLVYGRAGSLLATSFDADSLEVTGPDVPVLEAVGHDPTSGAVYFSLASDGTLVYFPTGGRAINHELVLVNRAGQEQKLAVPSQPYTYPRFSPDGTRLAVSVGLGTGLDDLWIYDFRRETIARLTFDQASLRPVWSPDGKLLAYSQLGLDGFEGVSTVTVDGSGEEKRITPNIGTPALPSSWSPDGKRIAYMRLSLDPDIFIIAAEGGQSPEPFLANEGTEEANPMFSPDGRWIAYDSNESGRGEVYVRAYPGPGGKWQISNGGGQDPLWSPDGKALYYLNLAPTREVYRVPVETQPTFRAGRPEKIYEGEMVRPSAWVSNWDVSPDGRKFVFVRVSEDQPRPKTVRVVLNWFEQLRRLAPRAGN